MRRLAGCAAPPIVVENEHCQLESEPMFTKIDSGIFASPPVNDTVTARGTVWSVQISEDPETGTVVTGDIETQTRRALDNLSQALAAAGASLADVVQVQIFLIEKADAPGMNAVYKQYFSEPYPIRATVVVKELLAEGLRIELLATAVIGQP